MNRTFSVLTISTRERTDCAAQTDEDLRREGNAKRGKGKTGGERWSNLTLLER